MTVALFFLHGLGRRLPHLRLRAGPSAQPAARGAGRPAAPLPRLPHRLMGGPCYRGWRLDGSLAEFHRAVDRLRWDTDPRRTEPAGSTPAPASRPPPARDREAQPSLVLPA